MQDGRARSGIEKGEANQAEAGTGDAAGRPLERDLKRDLWLFALLGALGSAATYLSVNIPHTEVHIEGRWIFGFMGFALLRRFPLTLLLAGLLSAAGPHRVALLMAFSANMLSVLPALCLIRMSYWHFFSRCRPLWLFMAGWFLLVVFCYQAFMTPTIWAFLSLLRDAPLGPSLLQGWLEQPYLVEGLLVAFVSASAMAAVRSHEALLHSRHELAIMMDAIGDGVIAADTRGRVMRMNPVACTLTGWTLSQALGEPLESVFQIINAKTRKPAENPAARVLQEGRSVGLANHTSLISGDGTEHQIADSASPIREADGRLVGTVMVFRDVSQAYRDREALYRRTEELEMAQQLAGIGSWTFYPDTEEVVWSRQMYTIFGRDPEAGPLSVMEHNQVLHPEDSEGCKAVFTHAIEEGKDYEITYRIHASDREVKHLHTLAKVVQDPGGQVVQIFGITRDISENLRIQEEKANLEAQFHQAQKLESVGRLAGGVAHDLNNLLSPILGYSELLLDDFSEDDARRGAMEEVVKASKRARDLVRQLLSFSRRQPLQFQPIDLNVVLTRFERLLRRTIREDVRLVFRPGPELPLINGDVGQLEQVVMNLAVNAQDAMEEGGSLTLETAHVELDSAYAASHEGVEPGPYVMLGIIDTGCGMDAETRERLFEPFFTTKAKDKGTGLGLATVYGIVKQHGGHIWVYSEVDRGTAIKVYLPVAEESDPAHEKVEDVATDLSGTETILLVEDDEGVRALSWTVLVRNGYAVLAAEGGRAAMRALELHQGPVHLVLTDVIMPDINGKELFRKVCRRHPEARALFMSGYTDNVIARQGVLEPGIHFIQKPFSVKTLAARVREVLDAPAGPGCRDEASLQEM
jgi:PAS domain S-box-containing protein